MCVVGILWKEVVFGSDEQEIVWHQKGSLSLFFECHFRERFLYFMLVMKDTLFFGLVCRGWLLASIRNLI